ncbi:DUF6603 domain-containing protein (plasmid) [Streptomyces sp. QH1-20]|uniref:DUF6603 domain-containing protein n=1 Tax=Streptomyces sp. QH1-20 TaxID=3240934 RepID=UPI0035181D74
MIAFKFEEGVKSLPLVGELVPEQADVKVSDLRVLASSAELTKKQIDQVNSALSGTYVAGRPAALLPETVDKGATLTVDVALPAQEPETLKLNMGGKPKRKPGPGPEPTPKPATTVAETVEDRTVTAAEAAGFAVAPVQAGAWLKVDKALGPVQLRRVGAAYQNGRLWLLFDAAIGAGGLTISADGLGLGVDLSKLERGTFDTQGALSGLGLDYKNPAVEIGGAFLNKTAAPYSLYIAGSAVVSTPAVGLQAVGAYQKKKDDAASLFLVAALNGKLPGPPPFRLKGIVAGFGYNSHLRVPAIAEVATFPLLKMLPVTDTEDASIPHEPMEVLDTLLSGDNPWVSAQAGTIWLAAGLAFSSFELLHARTVAVVEFGNDVTVSLSGIAAAQLPREGKPYANLELEVAASYSTATNMLAFDGQLTSRSFLLDENAHLRGGFAVRSWFAGSGHEGDFVLTLGGYHPQYTKPAHYPAVDRLGVDWEPGHGVTVKSASYLAVTPDCLMTGGALDIRYDGGAVQAWLNAHYDAIVQWAPLHFDLDIGITLGASLDCGLFTISGEIGASLNLWGPPVGGYVTVHMLGVGITISFGPDKESGETTVGWDAFRQQLLPKTPLTLAAPAGARPLADDAPETPWSFSSEGFTLQAATPLPATAATLLQHQETSRGNRKLDIRPMGRTGLDSHLAFGIEQHDGTRWTPVPSDHYHCTPQYAPVPNALWGDPGKTGVLADPAEQTVSEYVTGATIEPIKPSPTGTVRTITAANLAANPIVPDGKNPYGTPGHVRYPHADDPGSIATLTSTLTARAPERTALHESLTGLGFTLDANESMSRMAEQAPELFTARPQKVLETAA